MHNNNPSYSPVIGRYGSETTRCNLGLSTETTMIRITVVIATHSMVSRSMRLWVRRLRRLFDLAESSAWRKAERRYAWV